MDTAAPGAQDCAQNCLPSHAGVSCIHGRTCTSLACDAAASEAITTGSNNRAQSGLARHSLVAGAQGSTLSNVRDP
ncbi:MAG TPA: hypothetical protein VD994_10170 [Prosthecobacter sp.]|nr:hypothetical protein [Prosthecobacter sp.]